MHGRQFVARRRDIDIVADDQRLARPLAQQGAGADDADQPPADFIDHGKMANAQPLHARDGAIDH